MVNEVYDPLFPEKSNYTLSEWYLDICDKYKKVYSKIIVLMEVGSFFEAYGIDKPFIRGYARELGKILNMYVTLKNKKKKESKKNPLMAGFPSISIEKNLKVLLDNNYTVILIEQITSPPKCKRKITVQHTMSSPPKMKMTYMTEKKNERHEYDQLLCWYCGKSRRVWPPNGCTLTHKYDPPENAIYPEYNPYKSKRDKGGPS